MATQSRRSILRGAGALVAAAALPAAHALAQTWPADKPIRIIVPYPPGGSSDAISRLVALHLGKRLDRPVVIENIAGASGNIGTERVVRSAPDGHTIVLAATPLSTNPSFYNNIPFDVLTDLKPITMFSSPKARSNWVGVGSSGSCLVKMLWRSLYSASGRPWEPT